MNFGWYMMKFAILESERSVLSAETLLVCVHAFALGKQEILNFVFKSFHVYLLFNFLLFWWCLVDMEMVCELLADSLTFPWIPYLSMYK